MRFYFGIRNLPEPSGPTAPLCALTAASTKTPRAPRCPRLQRVSVHASDVTRTRCIWAGPLVARAPFLLAAVALLLAVRAPLILASGGASKTELEGSFLARERTGLPRASRGMLRVPLS